MLMEIVPWYTSCGVGRLLAIILAIPAIILIELSDRRKHKLIGYTLLGLAVVVLIIFSVLDRQY